MSIELEAELRAAFKAAGELAMPPADLAARVRQAVRRKLAIGGMAALAVLAVLAAAAFLTGSLVTGTGRPAISPPSGHKTAAHVIARQPPGQYVDGLAVSGRYLYVATDNGGNPPYTLGAYIRASGRLIRQVSVPALPVALSTGHGSVWLAFYPDQAGGPCGIWLLTADLDRRSAARSWCSSALLPTGRDTALTVVGNERLATVVMPPPSRPGRATFEPYRGGVGHYAVVSLAQAGTHVAALVTNDFGDYHVVIAGMPGRGFGGGSGPLVLSEAGEASGLWVVTAPNLTSAGPLVRLSDTLRTITPVAIKTDPILQQSQKVWSTGHTVWVATASPKHQLACFTYGSVPGKVATIPVRGPVLALAAGGRTVYVTAITPGTNGNAADVFSYTVPPQCR